MNNHPQCHPTKCKHRTVRANLPGGKWTLMRECRTDRYQASLVTPEQMRELFSLSDVLDPNSKVDRVLIGMLSAEKRVSK